MSAHVYSVGKEVTSGNCTYPSGSVLMFAFKDTILDLASVSTCNELLVSKTNVMGDVMTEGCFTGTKLGGIDA